MTRLRYVSLLFLWLAAALPLSAQEDRLAVAAEQAAVLESAPRLADGMLELDAATLADGGFVWIEVEENGFYRLSLSVPGALVLGSIPNADGRYDNATRPAMHGSSLTRDEAPVLGPVLLSNAHPYLLSVGSDSGAGTLTLEMTESVPALSDTPESRAEISEGDMLIAPEGLLDLTLPASPRPRKVEVVPEVRAQLDARLGSEIVPPGGRYPVVSEEPMNLRLSARAGTDSAPPRLLIRVTSLEGVFDEREPNESVPNELLLDRNISGTLLSRDEDLFAFSLEAAADFALSVTPASNAGKMRLELRRLGNGRPGIIWTRKPGRAGLEASPLALEAGDYQLLLARDDGGPEALPYELRLGPGTAPRPNREAEPNDTPDAAQPLTEALRISGTAGPDDVDVFRFSISGDKDQHLWRVFAVDASRLQLHGSDGLIADVQATGRRSTADALALTPGDYTVSVRAEGDYMMRVMDLGPRPSDYEGEPNDNPADGQRIAFGERVRGGFHRDGDMDYYLFRLDEKSAIELEIRPSSDGESDVRLYQDRGQYGGRKIFEPGDRPYIYRSMLPAGDWALVMRSLEPGVQEPYEIGIKRLAGLVSAEPDSDPLDAAKLPRDGDIAGSVGAIDDRDQVFVPLPEGEGQVALLCSRPEGGKIGRWRVYHWSDGSKVADLTEGVAVFNYGPELGGAVRLEMEGTNDVLDYRCALRFPPMAAPPGFAAVDDSREAVPSLAPGETRRFVIAAEGPEPEVRLDMEVGHIGLMSCRQAGGDVLAPDARVWELRNVRSPTRERLGDFAPFLANESAGLVLRRTYAQRLQGASLPMDVDCTLYGPDDLPRPSDVGPAAPFVIFDAKESDSGDGPPASSGPPPPGLEALLARETPTRQAQGDLPVTLAVEPLPELAGFSDAGQRFEATVRLSSEADQALDLEVEIEVPGEGWRVSPGSQALSLAPGATSNVTAEVVAPPWIAPAQRPELMVRARTSDAFAAEMSAVPVGATAIPLNPFTYWHAPDALRGGLNVLHHGLGARLTHWGDKPATEKQQEVESLLHDGLAPHTGSVNLPPDVVFSLAAPAELAGVMIQLRSTDSVSRWPLEAEVWVPEGLGESDGWRRVASGTLASVHAPQYLVFPESEFTDRLRFTFPRCATRCNEVYVQELQAIAVPGSHPEGLVPINVADPALGGHVVWASQVFGGAWNREFLVGDPDRSNAGWPSPRAANSVTVTVAFHQNRAARVQDITWIGDPDDEARIPEARVDGSMAGPNGPWTRLGVLTAPDIGTLRSTLELAKPAWARYLRFTFDLPAEGQHYGPDGIEVLETPGTSVLGLWEDDQPRAAFEASINADPVAPVQPAGGPTREAAVTLPLGSLLRSSVVIERNEDWWRFEVPQGPVHGLSLAFERQRPEVVAELFDAQGNRVALEASGGGNRLEAVLSPGEHHLRIYEPPRSVVITWDTSGSVAHYIPRTLAAVRTWGRSLQPGRDALQLLPFGPYGFLLEDWAETPEALEPALRALPESQSSDSENAMLMASKALADRVGARGIVIMTDAETSMDPDLWPTMLKAMPRVVSLSVDSDSRENAAVLMDWAALNQGRFQRVVGPLGLADGMDMANALFRAPKAYGVTATLEELVEPEGEATLTILPSADGSEITGAVEVILDASGSMLQRMEGRRRIEIAHEALAALVRDTLPDRTPFAFRAFGLEEDACRTELLVPLAPLDREAAARAIEAVPAINLAKTAIADSLRAAGNDLANASAPRVIVLVTDGEETCEGDPEAAIAELRASGFDARVNIVGFAIDDAGLAETFAAWAEQGGGAYFDAGGAEALQEAVSSALTPRFDIVRTYLDGRQQVVGAAALGETVTVPAGRLTITPGSAATGEAVTLQAPPRGAVSLDYAPGSGLSILTEPE